jgi:hypothetical protein
MSNRTTKIFDKLKNSGKYTISQYSYPSEIANEDYGAGHWIFFAINTVKGSKFDRTSKPVNTVDGISNNPTVQDNQNNANRNLLGSNALTKRIDTSIALYMPEGITSSINLNWETGEINAGVNAGIAYNNVTGAFENIHSDTIRNIFTSEGNTFNKNNITRNLLDFSQVALSETELANTAELLRRQFRNPYMEFLFKGVSARTFSLEFKFMPRNLKESQNVRNIIRVFKESALPELIESGGFLGSFYRYPNDFDIYLMSNTTENKFLHKMSTCALTNVSENYTPQGQTSFFENVTGEGNAPTAIRLSLTFTELELMTRARAEAGF